MKNNVSIWKNLIKIVTIAIMFVIIASVKSYAADPIMNLDNMGDFDFSNIPEADESSDESNDTTAQGADTKTSTPTDNSKTNTQTDTSKTNTSTESSKTNTSSAAENDIPATGSNTEIIFAIGAVAVVSAGIVLYKKQSIKLK